MEATVRRPLRQECDRRPALETWTGGRGLSRAQACQQEADRADRARGSKRQIEQIKIESRLASKRQIDAETASSRDAGSEMQTIDPKDQTVKRGLEAAVHPVSAKVDATLKATKNADRGGRRDRCPRPCQVSQISGHKEFLKLIQQTDDTNKHKTKPKQLKKRQL